MARSRFRWLLFPIQTLIQTVLENPSSAFGEILVLVVFFSIQILIKKALENCFFEFLGNSLVLMALFSIHIGKLVFNLLARSGFERCLFKIFCQFA